MSAANRNSDRDPFDYYPTPPWCVHRFLEAAKNRLPSGAWIEPAAGNGAIVQAVSSFNDNIYGNSIEWYTIEIQSKFKTYLKEVTNNVFIENFVNWQLPLRSKAKVCITNPPYKEALPIINNAMKQADVVCMLLRINFLASEKRYEWMINHMPDIYVLPNRPSFRGKGSDATEYAWFVWDNSSNGKITILKPTSKSVRSAQKRKLKML